MSSIYSEHTENNNTRNNMDIWCVVWGWCIWVVELYDQELYGTWCCMVKRMHGDDWWSSCYVYGWWESWCDCEQIVCGVILYMIPCTLMYVELCGVMSCLFIVSCSLSVTVASFYFAIESVVYLGNGSHRSKCSYGCAYAYIVGFGVERLGLSWVV